jgi:hypothetical protein
LYNLNGTRPASVEELTSECEKRALADKSVMRTAPAGNSKLLRPLASKPWCRRSDRSQMPPVSLKSWGLRQNGCATGARRRKRGGAGEQRSTPGTRDPSFPARATSGCDARRLRRAWRCGRGRNSWALGAPNAHSDGRMSPAFSDAAFSLCALRFALAVGPGTCLVKINWLNLIQRRSP